MKQDPTNAPVFLVASERSGTTLLRLMLDHHPDIAMQGEFEFAVDYLSPDGSPPALEEYYEHLSTNRVFRHWEFEINRSLDYQQLVADFLEQRRQRSGPTKRLVGATVHHRFHLLPTIWPEARYIHLLRDPRPVADSVIRMGWAGSHWHAADWWEQAERTWDMLVSKIPGNRWLEVRYESLLTDPRGTLEQVCAFMGTQFSQQMLEYYRDSTYPKVDASNRDQWRSRITHRQMQLVEARLGLLMEDRGYPLECEKLTVSRLHHVVLGAVNRTSRIRFAMRRFGIGLYLQEQIARRLRLRRWQKIAIRKMNAITERHLQ
jgi:hypothetical protein